MDFVARVADLSKQFDRELFVKWVFATPNNLFDKKVMFYPTTNTIMVEKVAGKAPEGPQPSGVPLGEPQVIIPFQATVTIESIAARPGISPREMALALRKWHDALEAICRFHRIREIYFMTADDQVAEFALGRGYVEINGERTQAGEPVPHVPCLAKWAKERGYPGPIKRVLKMKLHGPEDDLPENTVPSEVPNATA